MRVAARAALADVRFDAGRGMARLTLFNCAIVDATGRPRLDDGVVVIDGSRIVSVEPRTAQPPDGDALDMRGATLLPGLMDMHTHFSLVYPVGSQPPGWRETIPWRIAHNARAALN